jgi:hypothetical protein
MIQRELERYLGTSLFRNFREATCDNYHRYHSVLSILNLSI